MRHKCRGACPGRDNVSADIGSEEKVIPGIGAGPSHPLTRVRRRLRADKRVCRTLQVGTCNLQERPHHGRFSAKPGVGVPCRASVRPRTVIDIMNHPAVTAANSISICDANPAMTQIAAAKA